jgi:hypothetical protein
MNISKVNIPMNDIMFMQVFHALQYTPNDVLSIALGKLAELGHTFKEFSTDCQFEREIVLVSRFEPFVEFDLYRENQVSATDVIDLNTTNEKPLQYSYGPSR